MSMYTKPGPVTFTNFPLEDIFSSMIFPISLYMLTEGLYATTHSGLIFIFSLAPSVFSIKFD